MLRVNIEDSKLNSLDDYVPFYEYKGVLFTGILYEENEAGQIVEESEFFNGKLHGLSKRYGWNDALLYEEQNFEQGLASGWHRVWWERNPDKPQAFIFFEKGEAIQYQKWDEDGNLTTQKFLSGEVIEWDKAGNIASFCRHQTKPIYHEFRQEFYPDTSLKSQTIDAKTVGAEKLGFNQEYKEWDKKGILRKYKIWKFKKEKPYSKYTICYEFEQYFSDTGNLESEIMITRFEKHIFQANTHIWIEKKYYGYIDKKCYAYEKNYQVNGKKLAKSIKREKAISLKYHKQNPYKFTH